MTQATNEQRARYAVFDAFSQIVRQGYRGHAAGSERFLTSLNAALDHFAAAVRQDARTASPSQPSADPFSVKTSLQESDGGAATDGREA